MVLVRNYGIGDADLHSICLDWLSIRNQISSTHSIDRYRAVGEKMAQLLLISVSASGSARAHSKLFL